MRLTPRPNTKHFLSTSLDNLHPPPTCVRRRSTASFNSPPGCCLSSLNTVVRYVLGLCYRLHLFSHRGSATLKKVLNHHELSGLPGLPRMPGTQPSIYTRTTNNMSCQVFKECLYGIGWDGDHGRTHCMFHPLHAVWVQSAVVSYK